MNAATYEQLADSFGTEVPTEHLLGPAFKNFAEQQQQYWDIYINRSSEALDAMGGAYARVSKISRNYVAAIRQLKDAYINQLISQNTKPVPLILKPNVLEKFLITNPLSVLVALTTEIGVWLQETHAHMIGTAMDFDVGKVDIFDIERTKYLLAKNATEIVAASDFSALRAELAERSKELADLVIEQRKIFSEQSQGFRNTADENMKEAQARWEEKFEAFRAAKDEEGKIKKPVQLWSDAAIKHRSTFRWGVLALLIAFAGCSIAVFNGLGPLMRNIGLFNVGADKPESFTPASTLTLATLIALLTAAGFILKIAGRVITNSLTLAEDAEIRSALADTYLGLTAEEGGATSESRDKARTVMLAALFRPLPGHQQEEITAPTVLTLAQEMLAKKGGP